MSRSVLFALMALQAAPAWAGADLFACRIIVTGTDNRGTDAWQRCLADAIVKATGRPSLRGDARLAPILDDAHVLSEDFLYLDRMSDIPHHDEQGTRDRPYDLVIHFRPEAVTQRLAQVGIPVWRSRPRKLLLDVEVRPQSGDRFAVTADQDESERHRQAIAAAADRFGVRIALAATQAARPADAADPVLQGRLIWSPEDFGWNATWQLAAGATPEQAWSVRGVSFDEAYRAGIGGAAERLSAR